MNIATQVLVRRPTVAPQIDDKVKTWLPEEGAPPLFIEALPGAFPTVESSIEWIEANRSRLDALLLDFGTLVLRGFAFKTAEDFNKFTGLFEPYSGGYVAGASPRSTVVGNVMEATRLDSRFLIWLHQEMSYLPNWPSRIAFFGRKVPAKGGATIIGDMREFTQSLPKDVREKMEKYGVRGVRNYAPAGQGGHNANHVDDKGWDDGFSTTDREEVEEICKAMGIQPIWNDNGSLTVVTVTDAFTPHPVTGELFYRSNLHTNGRTYAAFGDGGANEEWNEARKHQAHHTGYALGNGEELTKEEATEMEDKVDSLIRRWQWKDGDIMLVDNLQVAHGRDPFEGDRETLVALFA